MSTRNIVGPIPDPDELYGRIELIENLWRQIESNNILLMAPRRFGKSGVMRYILLRPKAGFLPIYFELEDVNSPEEFVWRITRQLLSVDSLRKLLSHARSMPTAIGSWVKEHFDEVGFEGAKVKFKEAIKADWRESARRMLTEMEKADQTIIFIFDELPTMLEKINETCGDKITCDFLAWFRTVRLEQKDALRRHRFIVAGSIGIDTILHRLSAQDKFNDFQRVYVEPLQREVALKLASDLAEAAEIGWSTPLADHLLNIIGPPVPFFIHMFFSQLGLLPKDKRHDLTNEDLDTIYQRRVLGPTCKSYFDHYSARLKRFGVAGEKAAIEILRSVSSAPQGRVSRSALYEIYRKARGRGASDKEFDELLADLEHDWYLLLDPITNEYHFLLNIMRDWWRRWYPTRVKHP